MRSGEVLWRAWVLVNLRQYLMKGTFQRIHSFICNVEHISQSCRFLVGLVECSVPCMSSLLLKIPHFSNDLAYPGWEAITYRFGGLVKCTLHSVFMVMMRKRHRLKFRDVV
eukprot:15362817-Ditylum_brightwellii.AAC.2